MIEIFPRSIKAFLIAIIVKIYLIRKSYLKEIKLSLHYHPYKSHIPTTYFIIKSRFLTSEQMKVYLQDIRTQSELANIIIVGSHIDYEDLLKNHYRVFGVIDRTENQSISFLIKEIRYYLDGIYGDSLGRG